MPINAPSATVDSASVTRCRRAARAPIMFYSAPMHFGQVAKRGYFNT